MNRLVKSFLVTSTILLGMFGLNACGDDSVSSNTSSEEVSDTAVVAGDTASSETSRSSEGEKDSSSSKAVSSSSEGSSTSVKGSSSSVSSDSSAASSNSSSSDVSSSSSDAVSSATESSSSAHVSSSSEESSSSEGESSSSVKEYSSSSDVVSSAAAMGDYCGYEVNGDAYPLTEYYCKNDTAYLKSEYSLCGTAYYNTATQFCKNDTIYVLCGGEEYDPKTQFCYKDTIYEMCGGSTYTPRYEGYCVDNSFYKFYLYENHKNQGYFEDPRDHQLYKIGSVGIYSQLYQLWMLQNLNYKMTNSLCYGKDTANCSTYGRLYRFSEAYRACPAGWHLPTDKEFKAYPYYIDNYSGYEAKLDTTLTGEADTSDIAGKFLKADTSLWEPYDGIEVDDRGEFYALPGGWADVNRSTSLPTFYQLGKMAFFWTSTYDSPYATGAYGTTGKAMALILRYDSDKAVFRESDVYEALSVRCVRVEN